MQTTVLLYKDKHLFLIFPTISYRYYYKYLFPLKIRLHSKQELFDKDFLESSNVILFVEHEHSLLIVDGVNGSERNRAISICY